MIKRYIVNLCPNLSKHYVFMMVLIMITAFSAFNAQASSQQNTGDDTGVADIWTKANEVIVDIYNKIAGISTVLAGLMSAVAVIGAKMSNNQHKVDQAWDWLRRIWIAWAIINGVGAFIAYIRPIFDGFNKIDAFSPTTD